MIRQQKKKKTNIPKNFIPEKLDFRWSALIAIIAFALYANTIRHEYVLDDWAAITGNQFVQKGTAGIVDLLKVDFWHFTNLPLGYYRPLSLITFAIEHQIFGASPHISHLINVLLYSFTGFVLCLLMMQLFSNYNKAYAFLVCLLFIAHPVHTEVIANLKSRDEVMSFMGVICVLFIMFRYYESKNKGYLIISLIIYYFALLSKESAIMGIILLPVTLYFFKERSIGACIKRTIPFIIAVFIFYFQKYAALGTLSGQAPVDIINYPYVKSTIGSTFVIFAYCIKLLIFPHPLIFTYSYNQIPAGNASNPIAWFGFVLFIVIVIYTIRETFKKTTLGFALSIFLITLLPALAFVLSRGGIMAERFLYAPSLGFCIAFVYFLYKAFKVNLKNKEAQFLSVVKNNLKPVLIVAVVFVAYSFKTIDRNKDWHDNLTLSQADEVYSENNSQCNDILGTNLITKAESEKDSSKRMHYFHEGTFYLTRCVTITPKYKAAWCELGRAYQVIKNIPDSAIYYYKKSIGVSSGGYYIAYYDLATIYQSMGKNALASYYYNKAIERNPAFPEARQAAAELKKNTGLDVRDYPGGEQEYP